MTSPTPTTLLAPLLAARGGPHRREAARLLRLGGPIAAVGLLNMGMSLTDMVMMGWLGSLELAAGAVFGDFYSLLFYFAAGVLAALAPMIAHGRGAGDGGGLGGLAAAGLVAAAALGAAGIGVMWWSADLLAGLGIDGRLVDAGAPYGRAMAATFAAMVVVAVWRNLFAAHGRPAVFMWFTAAALPLNALGNHVLMTGAWGLPALGVAGVGLSSFLVALFLAVGLGLYAVAGARLLRLRDLAAGGLAVRLEELFRLGLPMGVTALGEVGVFLAATVVIGIFGAEAVAAHAIVLRVAGVIYGPVMGLSQAATIRTAFALGRGDGALRRRCEDVALAMGWVLGGLLMAGCLALAGVLPWLFLDAADPGAAAVAAAAAALFPILAVQEFAEAPGATTLGILRAHRDTRVPMVLTVASHWGAGLLPGLVLAFAAGMGAQGIWLGLALGTACASVAAFWRHGALRRRASVAAQPC
ncbi:MAG: hypothetical protein H6907_03540 [Hyphomicrobiales bacterium]|nr:hypothetical protein [Hyphomicrobiales bacterium]MCP5370782.1 hypothetical protein [Hyphomicrobiales bacterium]